MTIWFDVTSLLADPRRSGIQRVQRAILRHWPDPAELRPCRFDGAVMRACGAAVAGILVADAPAGGADAERRLLAPHLGASDPAVDPSGGRLLCAELFDDERRAEYYRGLGADVPAWLVYDALPWLEPGQFAAGPAVRLMPYLRALRGAADLAFISAASRDDFARRILHRPDPGPVLPLGADGLGLAPQRFDPARRDVVMLGTIEARKHAGTALRAAARLWAEGAALRLVMIGMLGVDARDERALMSQLGGGPGFLHLGAASDADIRAAMATARALLFPSELEGYGLPATEALAAGVPVIVAANLPSLRELPVAGQIRLAPVDENSIAAALREMLDDATAARLWDEAATLTLPSWAAAVADLAAWLR